MMIKRERLLEIALETVQKLLEELQEKENKEKTSPTGEREQKKPVKRQKKPPRGPAKKYPDSFEAFWQAYPSGRKKGKVQAFRSWQKAIKIASEELLIDAAAEYRVSEKGTGPYVQTPSAWLNQGCWDDDRDAWTDKRVNPITFEEQKRLNAEKTFNDLMKGIDDEQKGISDSDATGRDNGAAPRIEA